MADTHMKTERSNTAYCKDCKHFFRTFLTSADHALRCFALLIGNKPADGKTSSPAEMCVVELPFRLYCTVNVWSN